MGQATFFGAARRSRLVGATESDASEVRANSPLRLDRRFLLFSVLAALLLSWPLLTFGRPFYIGDSAAYYKGGRAAVSFVLEKFDGPEGAATGARPASSENAAREASGVRSITYSVMTYLLAAPGVTLVLLVMMQALAAGAVSVAALGAFGGLPTRRTVAALVILAGTSTLATTAMFAIPDIFAGLLVGSMVLLTAAGHRLSPAVRLLCVGIATFAVTAHSSHLPLAGGMTMLGLGWVGISRYYNRPLPRWTWAWVIAPLVIGGLTNITVNRIAFGEASLTAKRYPFVLARSINNGPGRWYLEEHCPELQYTICKVYPHGLPKGGALEFLWGKDGVVERATPAQMDRIRAEEAEVVLAAAREYSGHEARKLAYNVVRQLVTFRPNTYLHGLVRDETGTPQLASVPQADPTVRFILGILTAISAAVGAVWLGWTFLKKRAFRPLIALVFLGILGNAVTCVVFSAKAPRYQARVIWLLPLFALALRGSPARRRSDSPADARTEDDLLRPPANSKTMS